MEPERPLRDCGSVAGGTRLEEPIRRASAHARLAGLALGAGVSLAMMSSAASAQGLLEVFQLALRSDPEFLAMGAEHRADQETRAQAAAGLLPSADASLDTAWNERHRRRDYQSYNATLDIEFPIHRRDRRIAIDSGGQPNRQGRCALRRRAPGPRGACGRTVFRGTGGGRRARLRPGDPGGVRAAARAEPRTV